MKNTVDPLRFMLPKRRLKQFGEHPNCGDCDYALPCMAESEDAVFIHTDGDGLRIPCIFEDIRVQVVTSEMRTKLLALTRYVTSIK